ncbi:MAG: vitamin K epoxide reductase family protein [Candidatus Kariarchaeaceae archaeon]
MLISRKLAYSIILLSVLGACVSLYLTWTHYFEQDMACPIDPEDGCQTVNSSSYAKLWFIPVALLGFFSYLFVGPEAILSLKYEKLTLLLLIHTSFSFLFSLYLTIVEIWVIEAICEWCVFSLVIATLQFSLTSFSSWKLSNENSLNH